MKKLILLMSALLLAACGSPSAPERDEGYDVAEQNYRELHHALLVMDSHLDTPANLSNPDFDILADNPSKLGRVQVDLPKMERGGLDGGFWVIYTQQGPLNVTSYEAAKLAALKRSDEILQLIEMHPNEFELATTADDAERIAASGKKIVYKSIENSYPLGTDLGMIEEFYNRGVRLIGPVHFMDNQFADSATDLSASDLGGLTPLGEELIREANRLGMMIDASHAADSALEAIMEVSSTPVVLSHTGVSSLYDHPRNISDDLLRKVAADGGVIQINALGAYIEDLEPPAERVEAMEALSEEFNGMSPFDLSSNERERYLARRQEINETYPMPLSSFDVFMDQMLHALAIVGPDHVGMGADWDGGGGVAGMEDVSDLPKVTERLLEEGYSKEDLEKIWGGNLLRIMRQAEAAKQN
ncbi:dipeptidase [Hyphomonas atlantica]|uniref:dipeptidase n=1 Tax=Hyphomonas atlantica TaxID=1280948 RepID=UPI0035125D5B